MSGYNENLEKMTLKFLFFYLWHFLLELKDEIFTVVGGNIHLRAHQIS